MSTSPHIDLTNEILTKFNNLNLEIHINPQRARFENVELELKSFKTNTSLDGSDRPSSLTKTLVVDDSADRNPETTVTASAAYGRSLNFNVTSGHLAAFLKSRHGMKCEGKLNLDQRDIAKYNLPADMLFDLSKTSQAVAIEPAEGQDEKKKFRGSNQASVTSYSESYQATFEATACLTGDVIDPTSGNSFPIQQMAAMLKEHGKLDKRFMITMNGELCWSVFGSIDLLVNTVAPIRLSHT